MCCTTKQPGEPAETKGPMRHNYCRDASWHPQKNKNTTTFDAIISLLYYSESLCGFRLSHMSADIISKSDNSFCQ